MTNLYARKLEKIFNNVDKIAAKGRDNRLEYIKYIDELIGKGDYSAFQEMLVIFYQIDTLDYKDVDSVKLKTWEEILFQTKSTFMTKLSRLYKKKGVYQQSFNIYSEDPQKLQISLSNKLSTTYSVTSATPSILFQRNGDSIDLYVNNPDIQNIQIQKAEWVMSDSLELPTNIRWFQDLQISYIGNSFTTFNPSNLTIGDSFTMSFTSTKQFIPNQLISVTFSGNYIEGLIQSYNKNSGEAVIDITDATGSSTYSLWVVNYLSGPKSPTFSTSIPSSHGSSYLVTTTQKNDTTLQFEKFNYKLILSKDSLLGQIYEVDSYSPNVNYYIQNANYARIIGERKTYIEAIKVGSTYSVAFDLENPSLSDDQNLINRYTSAINYLLS